MKVNDQENLSRDSLVSFFKSLWQRIMIFLVKIKFLLFLRYISKENCLGFLGGNEQKQPFLMFSRRLIRKSVVLVTKIVIMFYLEIGFLRCQIDLG